MTPSNTELREAIRKILFSASGGVTDMANEEIDKILALFQAREQQLLTELLGELPEKKNYLAGIDREYINGGNDMLGQVVSVIERLQNKTNDGGRDGGL